MPVVLPIAPMCATPLPAQPQIPPTLVDIADAIEYNRNIRISQLAGGASKGDVGRGAVYETALIEENAGIAVAPPWFQPALDAVLTARLAPVIRTSNRTYNMLCGDGRTRPFETVPFINGDDPTDPQTHDLPALTNVGAINQLTGPQATSYLTGYHKPVPQLVIDRKNAIRVEIGCTAQL